MRRTLEKIAVLLSMALVCAQVGACRPSAATPEEALRGFLQDVRARRAPAAWAAISTPSQQALLADAARLAEATGDPPETDPAKLLFERSELMALRQPESISVASRPGDVALLRVPVEGGASANVRMVREGAAWKVDLVGSLERRPELPPPTGGPVPTATTSAVTTTTQAVEAAP